MNSENKKELDFLLKNIYIALCEQGYDPAKQLAGYILSEDPVYIPNHKNARGLIRSIDRDELIHAIIEYYFENNFSNDDAKV